ncbi:MAG: peptide-methionine (S)-S-oxide reductase [Gordonia sp. (in: high G+C Gram-positive bacteria)]|uniref:peptide-methionine (S)-S-oxide reductase n=1 Tax=Gordonia sp. (in: high G+C Gram-positive bacteria) TaxID=84139 RepID=UPI0039E3B943
MDAERETEELYLAGGCLWGVQAFVSTLPGVTSTEAGRANGAGGTLDGDYDGYVECVRTRFDPSVTSVERLMGHLFEIIDPYSVNAQGPDVGEKYRTGVYSADPAHLARARAFLSARDDADRIVVEVLPLVNYVRSAEEHQDRLARFPDDSCHLPDEVLTKYLDRPDSPAVIRSERVDARSHPTIRGIE